MVSLLSELRYFLSLSPSSPILLRANSVPSAVISFPTTIPATTAPRVETLNNMRRCFLKLSAETIALKVTRLKQRIKRVWIESDLYKSLKPICRENCANLDCLRRVFSRKLRRKGRMDLKKSMWTRGRRPPLDCHRGSMLRDEGETDERKEEWNEHWKA